VDQQLRTERGQPDRDEQDASALAETDDAVVSSSGMSRSPMTATPRPQPMLMSPKTRDVGSAAVPMRYIAPVAATTPMSPEMVCS